MKNYNDNKSLSITITKINQTLQWQDLFSSLKNILFLASSQCWSHTKLLCRAETLVHYNGIGLKVQGLK